MEAYWYLLLIAILCAAFSQRIDSLFQHAVKDSKQRAMLYAVIGGIFLFILGFWTYTSLHSVTQTIPALMVSSTPVILFLIGLMFGKYFGRKRK